MRPTPRPLRDQRYVKVVKTEDADGKPVERIELLRTPYVPVNPMQAAFAAAEVNATTNPKLVNRVLRVMKRHATRRPRRTK
jgi:hypothetical protein